MLGAAAAARWGTDASRCDTRDGLVSDGARTIPFALVAAEAAALDPPREPELRSGRGPLAGRMLPRLDLPAKSDGSLRFAGDVRLPGIRFASVRIAPPGGL